VHVVNDALMLQCITKDYCVFHHEMQHKNISTDNFFEEVCSGTKHKYKLPQQAFTKKILQKSQNTVMMLRSMRHMQSQDKS